MGGILCPAFPIDEGIPAKLIQTNDGFSLYNILEVRYFIEQLGFKNDTYTITDETWKAAKRNLWNKFKESPKIDICINLIKDFELSNPKIKYQSDFEVFVRESKLEDFTNANGETIFVSTIHKAKGKEFDNVFLLLNNYKPYNDSKKRELYVGMTRAKENLSIHLNGNYLDNIFCQDIVRINDDFQYQPSNVLAIHLSHRDIWLDYFISRQNLISKLKSGDCLKASIDGCFDSNGNCILKFSNSFKEKINEYEAKGYKLTGSKVNYIIYWFKEETEQEIRIVLPELKFLKQ